MDHVSTSKRSFIMRSVARKNTHPEIAIRKIIYGLGYRYRLNVKKLPGSPDIVFTRRRKVIFVHGCFWHSHECKYGKRPATNQDYWLPKLEANKKRDLKNVVDLKSLGWKVLIIWQCQIKQSADLTMTLTEFLDS